MIKVNRLNGKELAINSDLIEFIEETPDTVISLTTGRKIIVGESVDDIIRKIVEYKRKLTILPGLDRIYGDEV